jgi:hypothetical protein
MVAIQFFQQLLQPLAAVVARLTQEHQKQAARVLVVRDFPHLHKQQERLEQQIRVMQAATEHQQVAY